MVRFLIGWALDNPLVVILLSCALAIFGGYSFCCTLRDFLTLERRKPPRK